MATVTTYQLLAEEEVTAVTMTASDDAEIDLNKTAVLIVENSTGGDLTLNVSSANVTTIDIDGVGTIDLSGGKDFTLTDGAIEKIPFIPKYKKYVDGDSGTIALTGGTGATAYILQA